MRFLVLVKATKETEADVLPDEKLLTEMGKYNEELVKAGVMLQTIAICRGQRKDCFCIVQGR